MNTFYLTGVAPTGTVVLNGISGANQSVLGVGVTSQSGSVTLNGVSGTGQTITGIGTVALQGPTGATGATGATGPASAWGTIPGTLSDQTDLQTALNAKEASITAGTSAQYWRGDKTWQTLNQDAVPSGTTNKAYTATEQTKLSGIATGATANSSDATLLARTNHTGTQLAATISDFNTAVATTALLKANNLSDLQSASTARTNLGLGTLATQSGTFSGTSSGTNTGDQTISDATISTSDITTNNASTSKHGFLKKLPNDSSLFMDGTGNWSAPAGGGGGSGNVVGPAGSTDTAIALYDGTTGELLKDSLVTVDSLGAITTPDGITAASFIATPEFRANSAISSDLTLNANATGSGTSGSVFINAANATSGDTNGGDVWITFGSKSGTGSDGRLYLNSAATWAAILDTALLTDDRAFSFPDQNGTLATTAYVTSALTAKAPLASPSFTGTVTIGNLSLASVTGGGTITGSAGGAFNVTDQVYIGAIQISGNVTFDAGTRSIGATGTRVSKLWATNIESTNAPTVGGVALPTATSTTTITNKRYTPRVFSTTSTSTLTPEIATYDIFHLTAQAATLTIANHSTSTPADGEQMRIRILDNGTARAISFGTAYVAQGGVALPTTTVISKNMEMGFEWNANLSKWNLLALALEA